MSATGINTATTTTPAATVAAVLDEVGASNTGNYIKIAYGVIEKNGDENSSFCNLPSLNELHLSSTCNDLEQKVPLENCGEIVQCLAESDVENSQENVSSGEISEFAKYNVKQIDVENSSVTQASPGLSLLQQTAAASSPPPHSYRHSRAYRHFKNPPQPHMCIRTTTEAGEELFINVLSWTRIVIPQEPSDPIPLYGGMRVPPGSPRSPPVVFAVMANPEVLKDSGRHSKDPEERRAMVELMCDFVEAMNPGVKLVRNAVILKDRDISGELKDVWNAVQAQRDREREEQMLLQRQQHQQHFHNISNGNQISTLNSDNMTTTTQQMFSKSLQSGFSDDAMSMAVDGGTPPRSRKIINEVQNDNKASNIDLDRDKEMTRINNSQVSIDLLAEHLDNNLSILRDKQTDEFSMKQETNHQYTLTNNALTNINNIKNFPDREKSPNTETNNEVTAIYGSDDIKKTHASSTNGSVVNCNDTELSSITKTAAAPTIPNAVTSTPAENPQTPPVVQQAPTKKEKLVGFLPNGCIFPRFTKNHKHKDKDKDKDKDKEKEPKTNKERNALLNALKKSKDKKSNATTTANATAATASSADEKNTSSNSNTTAANCSQTNNKQQKNCLQQLECGVQKLDLNNHHAHIVDNNISNSAATNKTSTNTTTNSNTGGVSVH